MHQFDLVLTGLDIEVEVEKLDAFERRVEDMTFASHDGVTRVAVEREADSLAAAIRSAIADVESIPGVRVERVEPDEYVSQVEIAARLGRSRQSVSQLVSGARGRGDFPAPAFESGRVALWRWSEVSEWLASAGLMADRNEHSSRVISAANAVLEARRAVAPLNGAERSSLSDLFAA